MKEKTKQKRNAFQNFVVPIVKPIVLLEDEQIGYVKIDYIAILYYEKNPKRYYVAVNKDACFIDCPFENYIVKITKSRGRFLVDLSILETMFSEPGSITNEVQHTFFLGQIIRNYEYFIPSNAQKETTTTKMLRANNFSNCYINLLNLVSEEHADAYHTVAFYYYLQKAREKFPTWLSSLKKLDTIIKHHEQMQSDLGGFLLNYSGQKERDIMEEMSELDVALYIFFREIDSAFQEKGVLCIQENPRNILSLIPKHQEQFISRLKQREDYLTLQNLIEIDPMLPGL